MLKLGSSGASQFCLMSVDGLSFCRQIWVRVDTGLTFMVWSSSSSFVVQKGKDFVSE